MAVQHALDDRGERSKLAHLHLNRRRTVVAGRLVHALGEPQQEAQLGRVARLRLVIAVEMRRGLPPLVAADLDVAIGEHVLPGDEHVVEHDEAVGLVEPAGERVVPGIGRLQREGAA